MKAADARRQGQRQWKRLRRSERVDEREDVRCVLAERLRGAFEADKEASPVRGALLSTEDEVARLESSLATLDELKRWTDRFVEVQMMWVDCGARLDAAAALRVWNRMDKIMRRVTQQTDAAQQLALFHAQLPALVAEAAALVVGPSPRGLLGEAAAAALHPVRARVELPHQWLPRVLRDICDSVEREYAAARCRPALVDATRKILEVVRDRNPYAFLNILYRPPPPTAEGEEAATDFVLDASEQTDAIARLLHAHFEQLRDFAWWMEKPDASFWKTFARLLRCVRRTAVAFHHVMLHLYASAMQRQDARVTAQHVAQQIEAALAARASFALQTDGYGLAPWFATASDAIYHETFAMFPEVLVYVNAWRREFTVFEHGFAPTERARDYEIGYNKWKASKSWLEIAHQAKRAAQAWRRSKLGSSNFQPINIQQLGRIEKDIKLRLGRITDLLYRQNLAKWSQQRYQHSRARVLMELQILAVDQGIQTGDVAKVIKQEAPLEAVPSQDAKEKCFRAPEPSRRRPNRCTHDSERASVALIDEDVILKWTDDEIDAHEQETERVYELQGGMLTASEALSLSRLFDPELEEENALDALDEHAAAKGLLLNYGRLRRTTRDIVARGEEIALHSAAEALIQRPSLRATPISDTKDLELEGDSAAPPMETLEAEIRESAVRFLNLRQAAATDRDAQVSAHKLALDALALLRQAQDQTGPFIATSSASDGTSRSDS